MKVDLFNKEGKKTSQITLNDKVFAIKPNEHTIYLSVKSELAAKRQGTSVQKLDLKLVVVVQSHGNKKVLVVLELVHQEILQGYMVVQHLVLNLVLTLRK